MHNTVGGDGGAFFLASADQFITGTFQFERTTFIRNSDPPVDFPLTFYSGAREGGAIAWSGMSTPSAVPSQYVNAPINTKLEVKSRVP